MKTIELNKETGELDTVEESGLPAVTDQAAELEASAGIFGGIAKFKLFGLPIGQAGGALAIVGGADILGGILEGMTSKKDAEGIPLEDQTGNLLFDHPWLLPGILSFVMTTKFVRGWTGRQMADTAGLILLVDAIQASDWSPRKMIKNLINPPKKDEGEVNLIQGRDNSHRIPQTIEEYDRMHGFV